MRTYLERLDLMAGIDGSVRAVTMLERAAFIFLVLMVVSVPHSIAATQTAWLIGMFAWFLSLLLRWRSGELRTETPAPRALHIALWALFAWSVVTSLTSYAPDISINKLRGAAIFLIFYFVVYNIRNRRAVHFLAIILIASTMVNVLWTPVERLIGRGVEIHGLAPDGALAKALLWEGDTLLEANGEKLRTPEDVVDAIERHDTTRVKFYRPDFEFAVEIRRSDLSKGDEALSRLGITSWKKSRNWRSSGFYGHYTTYAEVLQLVLSLVLGLLVAIVSGRLSIRQRRAAADSGPPATGEEREASEMAGRGFFRLLALSVCFIAMCFALLLTVTRASQLAFLISAAVIVLIGLGRKWLVAAAVVAVPVALAGLLFLQQSRQVGFFDPNDDSIKWRQTVWSEGLGLWTSSPRNFVFGVGMDSIKRYAAEWDLFDGGRLNMGHFHSTPLNLVVERGLPALLVWLMILGVYARALWRGLANASVRDTESRGILLGCLGGLAGFFASGLVHYNLGDQEVAMAFFLLMGFGIRLTCFRPRRSASNG